MCSLSIDIVRTICYIIITARDKRCDRRTGDEPDGLSSISNPRRDCFVKAGDVPESTKPAATGYEEEHTMSINELEMKCRELRQLQALIDEAQAEAETIKDAIKAAMGTQEAVQAGEYKITWKPVKTARLDATALKKALPDVAARFTKETTVRLFSVA